MPHRLTLAAILVPLLFLPSAPAPMPVVRGEVRFVQDVEAAVRAMTPAERVYLANHVTHITESCAMREGGAVAFPWQRLIWVCARAWPFRPWDPVLLGSVLQHEARHVDDYWACRPFTGLAGESSALRWQAAFLERRGPRYSGWALFYRQMIGRHGAGWPEERQYNCP